MNVLHQKSPAAYTHPNLPHQVQKPTLWPWNLYQKTKKLLRYGKHSCLIQRSKRGFFYKKTSLIKCLKNWGFGYVIMGETKRSDLLGVGLSFSRNS